MLPRMEQGNITLANGTCYGCNRLFWFDPDRVVSVPIDPFVNLPVEQGGHPQFVTPQPMCPQCCRFANPWRAAFGLPLLSEVDTAPAQTVAN